MLDNFFLLARHKNKGFFERIFHRDDALETRMQRNSEEIIPYLSLSLSLFLFLSLSLSLSSS